MSLPLKYIVLFIIFVFTGCASSIGNADTFTPEGLKSGFKMTKDMCQFEGTGIWMVASDNCECIRYFHAGLKDKNHIVHIWFHGDALNTYWKGPVGLGTKDYTEVLSYKDSAPDNLQQYANREYAKFGIPYIRFSRPGVYGSSGDHNQRRRPREVEIVNAALDALKKKYNIESFILSGQSGGGHLVASLLSIRKDISCAVITSGVVAVAERVKFKGWHADVTGYADYYDPLKHINDIILNIDRPIFVVGDPRDTNVPFSTQETYYKELKKAGHRTFLIKANALGEQHHSLSHIGFQIVKWWHDGTPVDDIIQKSAKLYKEVGRQ